MKIHHFDGICKERWGFPWAMLVSGRVVHPGRLTACSPTAITHLYRKEHDLNQTSMRTCSMFKRNQFFQPSLWVSMFFLGCIKRESPILLVCLTKSQPALATPAYCLGNSNDKWSALFGPFSEHQEWCLQTPQRIPTVESAPQIAINHPTPQKPAFSHQHIFPKANRPGPNRKPIVFQASFFSHVKLRVCRHSISTPTWTMHVVLVWKALAMNWT